MTPDDARLVARLCRKHVPAETTLLMGMILWPGGRRSVLDERDASEIAQIAKESDITPVGVFVDESVEQMSQICARCGITLAQLHGEQCRASWASEDLHAERPPWIDVRDVGTSSVTPATESEHGAATWTIFDTKGKERGKTFNWQAFSPPEEDWLLAGGLDPDNVAGAVHTLRPSGLDVATGVAGPDKCTKDAYRIESFLANAIESYRNL